MESSGEKTTRARLTRSEAYRLMKWVEKNWNLLGSQDRYQSVADATKELGTEITVPTLTQCIKDMGRNLPWTPKPRAKSGVGSLGDRSRFLAYQMLRLNGELERLYGLLSEEYNPDGAVRPDLIKLVAQGKTCEEIPNLAKDQDE